MSRHDGCVYGGDCQLCRRGIAHAPLLIVYDPAERKFTPAPGPVCVARWASGGRRHAAGDICGAPADKTVAGIDLCRHHAERLSKWRYFEEPEERTRDKIDRLREADRDYEHALEESERSRDKALAARSIVYYIRRTSDGAVKIGTSTKFATRMIALRAEHGELQVLLTHGGTVREERAMHLMFRAYRIGRSEWFAPSKDLLQWIINRRGMGGEVQPRTWMSKSDLRKLAAAAPGDRDLEWRNGAVQWPPGEVAA